MVADFKMRLIDERNELDIKIKKLHEFLDTQVFYDLDSEQKTLLREQYKIMRQYVNILNCRLDILLTDEDKTELENGTK